MMRAPMPGLAKRAHRAVLVTEAKPCFVCVEAVEPGIDLTVTSGMTRYAIHRDHFADVDVERLLAKAAA
jgi:hypothetical protein